MSDAREISKEAARAAIDVVFPLPTDWLSRKALATEDEHARAREQVLLNLTARAVIQEAASDWVACTHLSKKALGKTWLNLPRVGEISVGTLFICSCSIPS